MILSCFYRIISADNMKAAIGKKLIDLLYSATLLQQLTFPAAHRNMPLLNRNRIQQNLIRTYIPYEIY